MRTEVKTLLKPIVKALQENDDVSRDLWNILTALRGPDDGNETLKEQTTARLRYAIGIKHFNQAILSREPLQHFVETDDVKILHHFVEHFNNAVEAIQRTPKRKRGAK